MSKKQKAKKKKVHTSSATHASLPKGVLDVTRSGIGYVMIGDGKEDVLVRPGDFNTALHGDVVRVKVIKENFASGKREGKITEVLHRKQSEFIGSIQLSTNFAFFVPDNERPMPDFFIPLQKLNGAKHKERVVAKMIQWEKGDKNPVGEVVSILAADNDNDAAMKQILTENGFPLYFDQDVLAETANLSEIIHEKEIQQRKDCRDILTFTIDPVDAKDFDDAISFRKLKNGNYEIGVHIADVSYYVTPNTALDEEAYKRATSVYLPDRVNPMLPEKISNELCSLRPHEDKLAFAAIFQISPKAEIKQYWLGRTVIHSNRRFTYEEVQEIIEGADGDYKEEILILNQLAQIFRKKRFARGAINFSSQEVRFQLDKNAKPIGILVKESKEAHQLIEEMMLLANKTVAENISKITVNKKAIPFPYRVHDTPDEEKLKPFMEFALKYGYKFDTSTPQSIAASFNGMLEKVKGKPEQHVLEQLGIRTMAKAIYTTENIGHYGLGFEHYCHFTSPIRRYPDVLVHRVLQDVITNQIQFDKKMEEKCRHCTAMERSAMEAERAANKYKQVEYLQDHLGEIFDGVVSGVTSFGIFVETVEHKCEGLVSIVSLSDYDDFRLIESDYSLVGKRSGRKFRMGDKISVKVVAANLEKRQLDFEWVLIEPEEQKKLPIKNSTTSKKKAKKKNDGM